MPQPLLADRLADPGGRIRHGFFTRAGGVSQGIYAGLNCGLGSDDCGDDVRENRRRVAERLDVAAGALLTVHQIHSPDVVVAEGPDWRPESAPKADGAVTDRPGLAVAVLTADCTPVLFADAEAGIVGAAHAGWRGAIGGVLENTIETMCARGAKREALRCAIGPTIAQPSYQVGEDLRQAALAADEEADGFFAHDPEPGRFRFDLPGYVARRLARAGLRDVENLARDTYGEPDLFYSYRRSCHRGEADYGRLIAAIALT